MHESAVIYRRSNHSVTFRCQACRLQWPITLASLYRAASTFAAGFREASVDVDDVRVKQVDFIAQGTKLRLSEKQHANRPSLLLLLMPPLWAQAGLKSSPASKPQIIVLGVFIWSQQTNAAQSRQAQQRFLGHDFLSHVTAQQSATCSRCHQSSVQLLQ